jgi:hypothetical protein
MLMLLCAPIAGGLAAAHAALATATGHWTLIAAAITGAVALALACTGRHRKGAVPSPGPDPGPGPDPHPNAHPDPERSRAARRSPGRMPRPITGKLAAVANRIVDRGELCVAR